MMILFSAKAGWTVDHGEVLVSSHRAVVIDEELVALPRAELYNTSMITKSPIYILVQAPTKEGEDCGSTWPE